MKSDNSQNLIFDSQVPTSPIQKLNQSFSQDDRRQGHWNPNEHKIYLEFLIKSKELMESSSNNKGQRLFKKMSQVIGTRSPSQCRSHHQKFNPFMFNQSKKKKYNKTPKTIKTIKINKTKIIPKIIIKSKQYMRKKFNSEKMLEKEYEELDDQMVVTEVQEELLESQNNIQQ